MNDEMAKSELTTGFESAADSHSDLHADACATGDTEPVDPRWLGAFSWVERREADWASPRDVSEETKARARRQLERWRAQEPLSDATWWQRRLELDDLHELSENELLAMLTVPRAAEQPPAFVKRLEAIYRQPADGPRPGGVFCWVEPLLAAGRQRLRSDFPELQGTDLETDLVRMLGERLHRLMARMLVLELRIAGLEQRLVGDTPKQRFQNFHEGLRESSAALELLAEYPVLARSLLETGDAWVEVCGELLRHAEEDRPILQQSLCQGLDPGPPVRVGGTGGDLHRRGRAVLKVRFASGFIAAYKPRSLAPECQFERLLMALAEELGDDLPRWPGAVDLGDHGWMPWVVAEPCCSLPAVERFYRRQGVLLAVLHVLGTTDLHFENLIAVGEHPVIIDLETLAHPVLPPGGDGADDSGLTDSVLRVGLLPHRLSIGDDFVDPSGLGADAGEQMKRAGLRFEGAGTDRMRVVATGGSLGATPGRPTLDDDRAIDPADYSASILDGFRAARGALKGVRSKWLAPDGTFTGALAALSEVPVRVVLRPTHVYALMLNEAYHPQHLRDGAERDAGFDRLWLGVRRQPRLASVMAAEKRDLTRGDVPVFTTRVFSRKIFDAAGTDCGPMLPESAADGIRRRLTDLGSQDDKRQESLIVDSFELRAAERKQRPRARSIVDLKSHHEAQPDRLIELATRAGDQLEAQAFRGRFGARWLVPRRLAEGKWTLVEGGPDLYYGLPGIAIFFATLNEVTGEPRYGQLADEIVFALRRCLAIDDDSERDLLGLRSAGAFEGLGGMIYTLVLLARLRRSPELLDVAKEQLAPLKTAVENDSHYDIVSGTAGALLATLRLHQVAPSSAAEGLIQFCAQHLAHGVSTVPGGMAWQPVSGGKPMGGMAHGVAGIAWALAEAGGHGRLVDAALDYEQTLFVDGNWRDLRERPEGESDHRLVAWCHGAAGIALARQALLQADEKQNSGSPARQKRLNSDIDLAVATTLERGLGLGHSLCHGDLGNLDALMRVAIARNDFELRRQVDSLAVSVAKSVESQGFLFGSPGGTAPPGLMVGLAGLGYGFLCLAAPLKVPSLLWLALPSED